MSKISFYFLAIIFLIIAPDNVFAASKAQHKGFVESNLAIVIKGNERVDTQTIESYLEIEGLKQGSQKAINESIKKLFVSDLFLEARERGFSCGQKEPKLEATGTELYGLTTVHGVSEP